VDEVTERWLPVVGFDGYEVSDLGRVRSLTRVVETSTGPRIYQGRVLQQVTAPAAHGYPRVGLSKGGVTRPKKVYKLVLEAFVGPCPPGQEGRHGPAGKSVSALSNLCYGTRRENNEDRARDGVFGGAQFTPAQADEIRARYPGESLRQLAKDYGTTHPTILRIIRRTGHYAE
jgi:hypothetical protein